MFLVAITDLSGKSKVILQIELILSRYKRMTKQVCSPPDNGKNVVPGSCVTLPNNALKKTFNLSVERCQIMIREYHFHKL